jgi:hypothetical protein
MNPESLPFCTLRALEAGVLGFELEGEMTLERLTAVGAVIADTCTRQKSERALADARKMSGDLSILEWHTLGTAFQTSWPAVRLAIVDRADRLKPDRFLETTARNRGINVRVFDDPAPALDWLRS